MAMNVGAEARVGGKGRPSHTQPSSSPCGYTPHPRAPTSGPSAAGPQISEGSMPFQKAPFLLLQRVGYNSARIWPNHLSWEPPSLPFLSCPPPKPPPPLTW